MPWPHDDPSLESKLVAIRIKQFTSELVVILNIYRYCITRSVDAALNKMIAHAYMRHRGVESDRGVCNPLNTKRRLFYLKTQIVPRSKRFSSRL